MSKRITQTEKIELVETENIYLALRRLASGEGGYNTIRMKRALYHALTMESTLSNSAIAAIRVALELP